MEKGYDAQILENEPVKNISRILYCWVYQDFLVRLRRKDRIKKERVVGCKFLQLYVVSLTVTRLGNFKFHFFCGGGDK